MWLVPKYTLCNIRPQHVEQHRWLVDYNIIAAACITYNIQCLHTKHGQGCVYNLSKDYHCATVVSSNEENDNVLKLHRECINDNQEVQENNRLLLEVCNIH